MSDIKNALNQFDIQIERERRDRINHQRGIIKKRKYTEDSFIRKEIFELTLKMTDSDFKEMRQNFFKDYYEQKQKRKGIQKLNYRRNCLKEYLESKK